MKAKMGCIRRYMHHLKIYVQGVYCTSLADFLLYGVGLNWRIKVNYTRQHVTSVYAERPTNLKEWSRAGASDRGKTERRSIHCAGVKGWDACLLIFK